MIQTSPLPADYQTALEEILRLREQLIQTNLKWVKAVERRELDNRANKGNLNAMQQTEAYLREELKGIRQKLKGWEECDAHCEYCPGVNKPHGPHND